MRALDDFRHKDLKVGHTKHGRVVADTVAAVVQDVEDGVIGRSLLEATLRSEDAHVCTTTRSISRQERREKLLAIYR